MLTERVPVCICCVTVCWLLVQKQTAAKAEEPAKESAQEPQLEA